VVFEHWGQDVDFDALVRSQGAIDLNAQTASCPACGASFATSATRCPSCGLRFG